MSKYQQIPIQEQQLSVKSWKILLDQIGQPALIVDKSFSIVITNSLFDHSEWRMIFEKVIAENTKLHEVVLGSLVSAKKNDLLLFQSVSIKATIAPLVDDQVCVLTFKKGNNLDIPAENLAIFHYEIANNSLGECFGKNDLAIKHFANANGALKEIAQLAFAGLQTSPHFTQAFDVDKEGKTEKYLAEAYLLQNGVQQFMNLSLFPHGNSKGISPQLKLAFDYSSVSVFIADVAGNIIFSNTTLSKKIAPKGQVAPFPKLKDLKCSSLATENAKDLWTVLSADSAWEGELGFPSEDGTYWGLFSVSPVIENENTVLFLGVEHTAQEIYTVLDELQKQYKFLDSIIDSLVFPFTVYNPSNYAILHSNRAAKEFTGKLQCKLVPTYHKPYCRACIASDVNYCLLEESYETKDAVVEEMEVQEHGSLRFYELSIFPVFTDGRISALVETAIDITDRKKLGITQREDDIHKQEASKQKTLLSSVINSIPDQIFYKDIEGSYFGANTAFLELAGVDSVNGMKDFDLFPKELAYNYSLQDQLVLKKNIPAKSERWVQYPNGKRVLLDTLRVPFKFGGDIVGVIGISRDITNIKRIEREILAEKEKVEKFNSEIQSQRDEIEKQRDFATLQNEEITQSINYALRIQNAVLPQIEEIDALLDDYFIFFKPRNIVSGDFYWGAQKGDVTLIAAADCTGHGVPGALMSILGVAFLKQVVSEMEGTDTGEILNRLRKHIILSLHQTGKEGEASDGMDIALYAINNKTRKLQFSGAYNPLYHVRDGKLTIIKGDKMPISLHAIKSEFTSTTLNLEKGDAVYIFSDGFADQFGGRAGKKLKYANFKKLILKYSGDPMKVQKHQYENYYESWKGNNEQVDDILLIGARF